MDITDAVLKSISSPESYVRGSKLFQSGAVYDTFHQEKVITGKCEGSSEPYYQVRVKIDEGRIQESSCTCSYDWGGACKHIIALVLAYIQNPDAFNEQKRIDDLLADFDKQSLVRLIDRLVTENPELYFWVLNAVQIPAEKGKLAQSRDKRKTQVSKTEYRRQIQRILHSLNGYRRSEAYWMMGGMVSQLQHVRDTANAFVDAGDADGALVILTTLLIEVGGSYEEFDDSDGELGSFLEELALPMVEAILSADLNKPERNRLAKELEPVINELSNYGIERLDVIQTALEEGWSVTQMFDLEEVGYREDAILVEAQLNVLA